MFSKNEWDHFLQLGSKSDFQWDVSKTCYIIFGTYGMSVFKCIKGRWGRKMVNDWRNKTHIQVNRELCKHTWEEV